MNDSPNSWQFNLKQLIACNPAISRCVLDDNIHRKNVISKIYTMPQDKMPEAVQDFIYQIVAARNTPAGLPFFIMQIMDDGWIKVQLFLAVEQDNPAVPKGMQFDSYISIEPMAALCISRDPEKHMSEAYVRLTDFLKEHSLRPSTPIFQVFGGDSDLKYTFLKVGYIQDPYS